jgi:hypothetical protein
MYVPDEGDVYADTPSFAQRQHSFDDYMMLGGQIGRAPKYKFLSKVGLFSIAYAKVNEITITFSITHRNHSVTIKYDYLNLLHTHSGEKGWTTQGCRSEHF